MPQLGYECFGHCSLYFVNFVQFIGFGLLPIAYFIIFANLCKSFLNEIDFVKNHGKDTIGSQWFSVLILAVLVFPLIIKKKIQELKIAGILLFSGVVLFIILMFILRMLNDSDLNRPPITTSTFYHFNLDKTFLSSLSTAFVAYGFQSAFFPIYNSLENKNYRNGMKFTILGMGFCFIIYMMVMFVSLYSFGINVHGDVLENVEDVTVWESYVLRSIFLVVMATHTPFIFFIGKESILAIAALIYIRGELKNEINQTEFNYQDRSGEQRSTEKVGLLGNNFSHDMKETQNKHRKTMRNLDLSQRIISEGFERNFSLALPFSKKIRRTIAITGTIVKTDAAHDLLPVWLYYLITFLMYAMVVTAASLITEVETVIKLIGSLANATLNFTFPGLFYFILMRRYEPKTAWWKQALAFLLFLYGVCMGLFLTTINIWFIISPIKNKEVPNSLIY